MNRKKIVIIISVSILFIITLIIIALFHSGHMATIFPQINDEMIEQANNQEKENRLAQKEQFAKEHENQPNSSQEDYNNTPSMTANSEDTQFKEEAIAQENFTNKVKEIMNRYYDNFDTIAEQKEAENLGIERIDIEEKELSEASIRFYDMVLTVLEKEDLSQEDRDILIELISTLKYDIEKNESLNARAENILQ